jgi:hypothetical protein
VHPVDGSLCWAGFSGVPFDRFAPLTPSPQAFVQVARTVASAIVASHLEENVVNSADFADGRGFADRVVCEVADRKGLGERVCVGFAARGLFPRPVVAELPAQCNKLAHPLLSRYTPLASTPLVRFPPLSNGSKTAAPRPAANEDCEIQFPDFGFDKIENCRYSPCLMPDAR